MELELVFNELSYEKPNRDIDLVKQYIETFILTLREATTHGTKRHLLSTCDLQQLEIGANYRLRDWRNDRTVRKELQQFFKSISTNYPKNLNPKPDGLLDCDYFFEDNKAAGLGIACSLDSLAVSLPSSDAWDSYFVPIQVHEISGDQIAQHQEMARNASRPDHVRDGHADWIRQRLMSTVNEGKDLWDCSKQFFPKLVFCEIVAIQMLELPKSALTSIARGLFFLNYYDTWAKGFESNLLKCNASSESSQTLSQYANERTFMCPDGQSRVFSWHAKVGKWRIYFFPDPANERFIIGYVGKHLRTVTFN